METENTTYDGKPIEVTPAPQPHKGGGNWFDVVSTWVSWIMVPLVMPVYGLILIFNYSLLEYLPSGTKWIFILIDMGINMVLPMLAFYLMFRFKFVSDIGLNERKDRWIPYLVTMFCMSLTGFYFLLKGAPMWMAMFFVGGGVAALINMVVTFWWKISAHGAGVAGIVALLVRMAKMGLSPHPMLWILVVWILLTGLVGACRIWQGRHTLGQVIAGYLVGFFSVYFLTML